MAAGVAFDTMEMAFVYGIVTLALEGSGAPDGPDRGRERRERVSSLLSQAGYEVIIVSGRRKGEPGEWMEVGRPGVAPEVIVDMTAPGRPRDTVLLKRSKAGRSFVRRG